MGIALKKGEGLNLQKGLKKVIVRLGWDENTTDTTGDFDLDATAFLLNDKDKCQKEENVIFYGNLESPCGSVKHSGDDTSGDEGEEIVVDLEKIPNNVSKVDFIVSIYEGIIRNQNFGMVSNAYIEIIDASNNKNLARYDLSEDFSTVISVDFGHLVKKRNNWRFEAVGEGYNHGLAGFIKKYGLNVEQGSEDY